MNKWSLLRFKSHLSFNFTGIVSYELEDTINAIVVLNIDNTLFNFSNDSLFELEENWSVKDD